MTSRRHHQYDWPAIVLALLMLRDVAGRRASASELARTIGCSKARLSRLRQPGTEPLHSLGERLRALHETRIGPAPLVGQVLPSVNACPDIQRPAP